MEFKEHSGIAIILGTKAELIKCMPIMLELQKQKKNYYFIHTGQHPLGKACEEFGIKKPDFILSKEPEISTKFWSKINKASLVWFLVMILKIKRLIRKLNLKYITDLLNMQIVGFILIVKKMDLEFIPIRTFSSHIFKIINGLK